MIGKKQEAEVLLITDWSCPAETAVFSQVSCYKQTGNVWSRDHILPKELVLVTLLVTH